MNRIKGVGEKMPRKLQMTLDEDDVRVLSVALGVLPLLVDDKILKVLLTTGDMEQRKIAAMGAALLAGVTTGDLEAEISFPAFMSNMKRGLDMLTKLHDWTAEGHEDDDDAA